MLRLYGLALSLVPDEGVAAELYMRSRSEAELRRAAGRWCAQQGLPAPDPAVRPAPLDAGQEDLALHLARRAQRRRRARGILALLVAALGLLVMGALPRLLTAQPTGLVADPIYAGQPLFQSADGATYRLLVYRAEAVPGATTVWWELRGPRAGELAGTIARDLTLFYAGQATVETTAHRKDRLLGRSVFPILNPSDQTELSLTTGPEQEQVIPIRLTMLEQDPAARTIAVADELEIGSAEGHRIAVDHVRIGQHATTVALRFPDPQAVRFPDITADGKLLGRAGVWQPTRRGLEYELVLHPLPPDARQIQISYKLDMVVVTEETIALPSPDFFLEWKEEEGRLTALFLTQVAPGHFPGAHLTTRDGSYVPAQITMDQPGGKLWRLSSDLVSWAGELAPVKIKRTAADLAALRLYIPRTVPDPSLTVELR